MAVISLMDQGDFYIIPNSCTAREFPWVSPLLCVIVTVNHDAIIHRSHDSIVVWVILHAWYICNVRLVYMHVKLIT